MRFIVGLSCYGAIQSTSGEKDRQPGMKLDGGGTASRLRQMTLVDNQLLLSYFKDIQTIGSEIGGDQPSMPIERDLLWTR